MLIFQIICIALIAYNIVLIILGFRSIRDLKYRIVSHTLNDVDAFAAIISIKDKIRTSTFRIVVYSFIIIVLKYLSLS